MKQEADIRIAHLAEHEDAVPQLAAWALQEWGHLEPGNTQKKLVDKFKRRTTPGSIPQTLVAVEDERIVGMASIVENDLSTRPDLTPWMASVYVDSEHRNRGIGSQIVRAIMAEAALLALDKLYLITHDRMSFYAYLGWTPVERVHYRGEDVTVMVYEAA